jgi:hypothetical protein
MRGEGRWNYWTSFLCIHSVIYIPIISDQHLSGSPSNYINCKGFPV